MSSINRSSNNLLRRYLTGAITAPEEAELERRAQTDDALAEAMRGLQAAPEEDHAARVSRMVSAARKQGSTGARVVSVRPNRYRWAAAAGILLLLVSSLFFLPTLLDSNTGDLAMESAPLTEEIQTVPDTPVATPDKPVNTSKTSDTEAPSPAPASSPADLRPRPAPELKDSPKTGTSSRAEKLQADAQEQAEEKRKREELQKKEQRTAPPPPLAFEEEIIEEDVADDETSLEAEPTPPPVAVPSVATAPASPPTSVATRKSRAKVTDALPDAQAGAPAGYTRSAPTPSTGAYLDGRITNENGYPIINALVRLPGLPLGERTDSNGVFQLPADAPATSLIISHPNYESERVDLNDLGEKLQISLERKAFVPEDNRPRWQQNGASTRIIFDNKPGYASPLEGYNALRKRIEESKPADVPKGKVKLSFLVNLDGTLTDFQFRGKPSQATMDFIGQTLVTSSVWEVIQGEEPVRVYFKVVFE